MCLSLISSLIHFPRVQAILRDVSTVVTQLPQPLDLRDPLSRLKYLIAIHCVRP
jgi:hypothetical protein